MKGLKISIQTLTNKIIAILVIFCIIFANFAVVGSNIVEAVADELENQKTIEKGENISFDAFFEKEGNRTHQAQLNMEEEQNLHIELVVKDKFSIPNATIKIEDANFDIIKDKVESNKYINNINTDTNEIELKNIYSNNKVSITLPIKFKKSDLISKNYFNKDIEISLKGKYEDTKQREKTLEGIIKIKPEWTANTDINLTQSIEKYFSLGANGTLLQQKIETEVVRNVVPRNTETIQTIAPLVANQRPEKVTVLIDGERINNENVKYNKEDGTVLISYTNIDNNEGNIKWGEGKKEYTIMYNYLNTAELVETQVELKTTSQTSLYTKGDNITKENTQNIAVTPVGNLVTSKTTLSGDIYKGYLYENEEKEIDYKERNDIEVSYTEGIEKIELQTNNNIYTNEAGKGVLLANNLRYKETKVNKAEILNVLGGEGILTIKRANGEVITQINKDTEANEEGIITVTYGEAETNIIVETTAPKIEGVITVLNTKAIKGKTDQPKNTLKSIKNLVVVPEVTTNMNKESSIASIELKESTSEASIETNAKSLTTTQENKNVEIKATLKTNSPSQNLYANPTVTIEFPKDVQTVKVNSINKIFGDEFSTVNASQGVIDGKQVIKMQLIGEQKEHKEVGTEGTIIDINANLTLNNKALSKKDNIVMTYTNANQNNDPEQTKTEGVSVDIVSPRSLITTNNIPELGISTVGEQKEADVKIPVGAEQKVLTVESEVINNNEREISDVKVMGTFGTSGKAEIGEEQYENNINTQLTSLLNIEGIDISKVKVYYTENENATEDIEDSRNKWQETVTNTETTKKYLVQVSNMNVAETMKISYGISVPENLQYKQQMYQGYTVKYNDNQVNAEQEMEATTIALKTGKGPIIETNLTAKVGAEGVTEVKKGGIVKYEVKVKNTGDEDLSNVAVITNIPTELILLKKDSTKYTELEDRTTQTIIEELKIGETKTIEFEAKVRNETPFGTTIKVISTVQYQGLTKQTNEADINVSNTEMLLETEMVNEDYLKEIYKQGDIVQCRMTVKNVSDKELNNISTQWILPEEVELKSNWIVEEDKDYTKTNSTIERLEPGETKTIKGEFEIKENKDEELSFSGKVMYENDTYNIIPVEIETKESIPYTFSMKADVEDDEVVPAGETITYLIQVKNNNSYPVDNLEIKDDVANKMQVTAVNVLNEDGSTIKQEAKNNIKVLLQTLQPQEEKTIKIEATPKYQEGTKEDVEVPNKAQLMEFNEVLAETEEIKPKIEKTEKTQEETTRELMGEESTEQASTSSSARNEQYNNDDKNKSTIKGYVWADEDSNGEKGENEQIIGNVPIKLLDVTTNQFVKDENGNEIETQTNDNGKYVFENLPEGEYSVVFDYNKAMYKTTSYQKSGVREELSSKAISKSIDINNEEKTYGITDKIELGYNDKVSYMNLGLIPTGKFDLSLEKYINKITVRTSDGNVKTYNYNKETLAKVELDSKKMEGADVIVEYKIEAKNIGEVSGYVKTIEDYIPEDMVFNSELNSDWYQSGSTLKTNSLQNKEIAPGESGIVTLVLTKTMTESNTGIMGNTAEITEAYNEEGIQDINSTPGNGDKNENDYSRADTIISVKTGAEMTYIALILVIVSMIGIGVYFIRKETLEVNDDIFKGL